MLATALIAWAAINVLAVIIKAHTRNWDDDQ